MYSTFEGGSASVQAVYSIVQCSCMMLSTLLRPACSSLARVATLRGYSVLQQRCYTTGSDLNVTVEHLQDEHTGMLQSQ